MRFDDRIATALDQPETNLPALIDKWRQLVDILAQNAPPPGSPQRDEALQFLLTRREEIDPAIRARIAAMLPAKIADDLRDCLSSAEAPASPVIAPRFHDEPSPLPSARKAEAQIRELLGRLDAFQKGSPAQAEEPRNEEPVRSFRWEAGPDGTILWVEGVPRGAVIGQSIASAGSVGQFGVDGQVSGAFRRRAPFRDARFCIAGSGLAAGDWRISGVPFFDPSRGSFLGYRGSARRPRMDEVAASPIPPQPADGLFGPELQPDALRQLVHELRTPLNAVLGFAEMIEGQFLGPAADGYRGRAHSIREEAARMLAAVDDLDTAARIETSSFPIEESSLDFALMLIRLHAEYARVAHHRNAILEISAATDLPNAMVEPVTAERMCARLLASTIGLAGEGERLLATIDTHRVNGRDLLRLSITRPRAIEGRTEAELLDPGYTPEGDWPDAPALGLGFALRLVRNLAETVGGGLIIAPDRFLLHVPAAAAANLQSSEGA